MVSAIDSAHRASCLHMQPSLTYIDAANRKSGTQDYRSMRRHKLLIDKGMILQGPEGKLFAPAPPSPVLGKIERESGCRAHPFRPFCLSQADFALPPWLVADPDSSTRRLTLRKSSQP
jgi:hypothetical protein